MYAFLFFFGSKPWANFDPSVYDVQPTRRATHLAVVIVMRGHGVGVGGGSGSMRQSRRRASGDGTPTPLPVWSGVESSEEDSGQEPDFLCVCTSS
mmetsp:Transcript_36052/g.54357  ORF Transcript_36052/g.54357 Transcript_36052/m.54357 type:complete len:95 (-) Transcript_36052:90-374(-)